MGRVGRYKKPCLRFAYRDAGVDLRKEEEIGTAISLKLLERQQQRAQEKERARLAKEAEKARERERAKEAKEAEKAREKAQKKKEQEEKKENAKRQKK